MKPSFLTSNAPTSRSVGRCSSVALLGLLSLCLAACSAAPAEAGDALDEWDEPADPVADIAETESELDEELDPVQEAGSDLGRTTQALSAGCTLLRPLGWSGRGVTCVEKPTTPFPMRHGQVYTAVSGVAGPIFGVGHARVRCNNGRIVVDEAVCRPGGGVLP